MGQSRLYRTARLLVAPRVVIVQRLEWNRIVSEQRSQSVGMIGLGIMGAAMSKNLLHAGFSVIGYDISAPALAAFAANGGQPVNSAREVAAAVDILITSLPSTAALHDVVGELKGLPRADRILAETSTFALEDKFKAQSALGEAGIIMLDCPLSGSGSQALERDVLVYGSGPRQAYDRCLRVFQGFSRAPHYLGPFGNGSKMKYIANLLVAIHTVAAGEAFALARRAGLDPAQMFEVVSDGAGGSRALQVRGPMLISDDYLPIRTMPLELWRKDLRIIGEFANSLCCPTPLFSACVPLFNAAVASGYGDQDTAAVCAVLETMAGLDRG
jgi:3-hydroxyisobutyrate dehydrogenase-like beta-hydroxyacid dehydrogenase